MAADKLVGQLLLDIGNARVDLNDAIALVDANLAAITLRVADLMRVDTHQRGSVMHQERLGAAGIELVDGALKRGVELALVNGLGKKPRMAGMVGSRRILEISRNVNDLYPGRGRNGALNELDPVCAMVEPHVDKEDIRKSRGNRGGNAVGSSFSISRVKVILLIGMYPLLRGKMKEGHRLLHDAQTLRVW